MGNDLHNNTEEITERRSGEDRRTTPAYYDFPFVDSHGHLVTEERRKLERRTTMAHTTSDTQLENTLNTQTA